MKTSLEKRYISTLLLVLFLFYFAGTQLFVHTHNIDGIQVVHSHPYGNERSGHSHTTSQLIHISILDGWAAFRPDNFIMSQMQAFIHRLEIPLEFVHSLFFPQTPLLRGPPYKIL